MKLFVILYIVCLSFEDMFAQVVPEKDRKELYPEKYSFEKADTFEGKGEYEKAMWFYINLYPENKERVLERVKNLSKAWGDSVDMKVFIMMSYAQYSAFDPVSTSFKEGKMSVDLSKVKQKSAWSDELIAAVVDNDKVLSSATEYNKRGLSKAKAKDFKGAIIDFDRALELEQTGQFFFNRAFVKGEIKDFKGAIIDYTQAIERKYRLAEAYFERGYCKAGMKDFDGAIGDYTKAIAEKGDYWDPYNNRGFLKFSLGDFKGAIKDFDQAIKVNPKRGETYLNRGVARLELKDKKGACKDWKLAVELGVRQANKYIEEHCE